MYKLLISTLFLLTTFSHNINFNDYYTVCKKYTPQQMEMEIWDIPKQTPDEPDIEDMSLEDIQNSIKEECKHFKCPKKKKRCVNSLKKEFGIE